MLKVALRGLDRVVRDTGDLKPWDKCGSGGAGSCLWQHCGGGLPGWSMLEGANVTGRLWDPIWAFLSTAGGVPNHSSTGAGLIPPSLQGKPMSSAESARTLPQCPLCWERRIQSLMERGSDPPG